MAKEEQVVAARKWLQGVGATGWPDWTDDPRTVADLVHVIEASDPDAKREAQAHRMAEQNRIIRLLTEEGVDERILERVRSEGDRRGWLNTRAMLRRHGLSV